MADMNVYLVVSEDVEVNWYGLESETRRISELVVAKSHGQARWIAFRANKEGLRIEIGRRARLYH